MESYVGLPLHKRLRPNRPLTSYTRVQKLIGSICRNRKVQLRYHKGDYLNAGCETHIEPGFINLDYEWRPGALCWDLTKRLPFADQSLKGIFTEHCLEHIGFEKCLLTLKEFRRVLRPEGTCRIILPDAGYYIDLYKRWANGERPAFPFADGMDENWTPMMEVNRTMRRDGHQFGYDVQTISLLLKRAGFTRIEPTTYLRGCDPKLLRDTPARQCESLYVEAR